MRLENIVWDAHEPQVLGPFWAKALGTELITDTPTLTEARLQYAPDFFLDLCFEPVESTPDVVQRLHLDLLGGDKQDEVVERLIGLGATKVDIGQGDVPWVVLADPEGNAFCVMEHRDQYLKDSGPIAGIPLDSNDPARDGVFWAGITGWDLHTGEHWSTLQHPSGVGPLLLICPEEGPREGKSVMHLDVRPEEGDEDPIETLEALGGTVLEQPAPGLSWTVCADPSGNEVCLLGVAPPDKS